MLGLIREILLKIVDDIDTGNSNISDDEAISLLKHLSHLADKTKRMSKYEAYTYLNISRATFDNYIREGKIPKGVKQQGFKELSWSRKDLNNFIKNEKKSGNIQG